MAVRALQFSIVNPMKRTGPHQRPRIATTPKGNVMSKETFRAEAKFTLLGEEGCDRITDAVCEVLENTGCLMKNAEARTLLEKAGCTVDGEHVRIPKQVVLDAVNSAPKADELVIYDRNGKPAITFEDGDCLFGPAITTVFIIDPGTGEKRRGTRKDAERTAVLLDGLENFAWVSTLASINDGDAALTDIYEVQALVKNTEKPIMYWSSRLENLEAQHEMFYAVAGGKEAYQERPFAIDLVCPLDPLVHPDDGLEQLIFLAQNNSPAVYIAGAGMGSTCPITIAGCLTIGLADTLAGLVVSQLANPGAPFIASKFSDNIDMRTVSAYFSSPEWVTANMLTAEVFRRLNLPFCLNYGASSSGHLDQIAAFDIAAQYQAALLSDSSMNFAAGAVENGNVADYAALVFANDIIGYLKTLFSPVEISDETLLLQSIDEVGPGGNFLAEDETLENFGDMWAPEALKPLGFDKWMENGGKDTVETLRAYALDVIAEGSKHPLDAEKARAVDDIVTQAESGK